MIEIKNRFNNEIICKGDNLKDLVEKNKAYLRGAYLRGANLRGANLGGAYLWGAYLWGANLGGAKNLPSKFKTDLNILKYQINKLIGFKYLNGKLSPYQNFEYELGKTYVVEDGSTDERILCDKGINLASLQWCLRETDNDLSKTYAIFEFDPKDILAIPYNSDGKFRVSKATYIRNLTEEELKKEIEDL